MKFHFQYSEVFASCLSTDESDDHCEVDIDSMFGIYRAPYEKPTPLRCIEPLYQLNEDGSVPGEIGAVCRFQLTAE